MCGLFALLLSCNSSLEDQSVSLRGYKVEEGFKVEMLAAEPLLKSPVAMDFDDKGRIWVAEMPGYMNNIEGRGEKEPTGAIRILEDLDGDGIIDHSKVFLDSLVMPRAISMVYNGLLYAEPPNLWFVEVNKDKPGKRVLVDSLYAPDGNPEQQSNGLILNIDNWIYSAKHSKRYQLKDGKWLKEPTTVRGQWGITHDNFGRLYYNDNARQLLGDYILPNRLVRNKFFEPKQATNRLLTDDQRVYPLHVTSVNRGYAPGVLNSDSLLMEVTSACGPLIYRGGTFPADYNQNAFVCIPEANLIKRNILSFHGDSISARQAWEDKEFLASTDEGFRPVNLYNGPDGAIYIVDMHIGLIQHYAFLSPYLKGVAQQKQLDTITGYGRILRVKSNDAVTLEIPDFNNLSGIELVELLKAKNGWIRDRAQHHLIFKDKKDAVPELKKLATETDKPLAQLHALHTLEGIDSLNLTMLKSVAIKSRPDVTSEAIVLMENFVSEENADMAENLFKELLSRNDKSIDLYLSTTVATWAGVSEEKFGPLVNALYLKYADHPIMAEALMSGMGDTSESLLTDLRENSNFKGSDLQGLMVQNIERQRKDEPNSIFTNAEAIMDVRTNGAKLFRQICAACHGINGAGNDGVAPPLMNSEYVASSPKRLGLILLHGLSGPIHVNGERYEFNQAMPGLINNPDLSDKDISDIMVYVTNAFSKTPHWVKPEIIKELRTVKSAEGGEYSEAELLQFAE